MLIETDVWGLDLIESHVWYASGSSWGILVDLTAVLSGDFTLIGWYKGIDVGDYPFTLWDAGTLEVKVKFNSEYELNISDDNGSSADAVLDGWGGSDWINLIIIRSGTTITVYQNKVLILTYESSPLLNYSAAMRMLSGTTDVFDLRVLPRAISLENLTYYYDNVVTNQGDAVLPNF